MYIQQGLNLTISSDDNSIFGTSFITDDLLAAYLAWDLDLFTIKKLLMNSIEYSTLQESEISRQLKIFEGRWETFIRNMADDSVK